MPLKLVAPAAAPTAEFGATMPERPGPPPFLLARDDKLRLATGTCAVAASSPVLGAISPPPAVPRSRRVVCPPLTTRVVIAPLEPSFPAAPAPGAVVATTIVPANSSDETNPTNLGDARISSSRSVLPSDGQRNTDVRHDSTGTAWFRSECS